MLNLINFLDTIDTTQELCDSLRPVLRIVGYVLLLIKIAVPIILIVVGIVDLMNAVSQKKDDDIKKAQQLLVKRVIAAVMVFLVATLVSIVMRLVGNSAYTKCMDCIDHPTSCTVEEDTGD